MSKFIAINILLLAGLLALGGCAGALPWNDQEDAGIYKMDVETSESETGKLLLEAHVIDGKESGSTVAHGEFDPVTGKMVFDINRGDVKAFEGQATRADVEKIVADKLQIWGESFNDTLKELLPKLINPVPVPTP